MLVIAWYGLSGVYLDNVVGSLGPGRLPSSFQVHLPATDLGDLADLGQQPLTLCADRLCSLALGDVENKSNTVEHRTRKRSGTQHDGNPAAVGPNVLFLKGCNRACVDYLLHGPLILPSVFPRRQSPPIDPARTHFLPGVPHHLQERIVGIGDSAVGVPEHRANHSRLEEPAEAGLACPQGLLGLLALGYVSGDSDHPDYLALQVAAGVLVDLVRSVSCGQVCGRSAS